ncbi:MAG: DUF5132 domain-containing protein [Thermodesulfovibrionales bacterium]|nr:DUF5132 domain-containing protein [Thermodesulfovibrionales bacterium]
MSIFNNGLKGNLLSGLAIGIGATIVAPIVLPILASAFKPIAKAAIKSGIMLYERGKETVAEVSEMFEDIVAEAKAEMSESHIEPQEVNSGIADINATKEA